MSGQSRGKRNVHDHWITLLLVNLVILACPGLVRAEPPSPGPLFEKYDTTIIVRPGLNLLTYPFTNPDGKTVCDWMEELGGDVLLERVLRVGDDGVLLEAAYREGQCQGDGDGVLQSGEGYLVEARLDVDEQSVTLAGDGICPDLPVLGAGLNLMGVSCPEEGAQALDLLEYLWDMQDRPQGDAMTLQRLNPGTGLWETAVYRGPGTFQGVDFPLSREEGYMLFWRSPFPGGLYVFYLKEINQYLGDDLIEFPVRGCLMDHLLADLIVLGFGASPVPVFLPPQQEGTFDFVLSLFGLAQFELEAQFGENRVDFRSDEASIDLGLFSLPPPFDNLPINCLVTGSAAGYIEPLTQDILPVTIRISDLTVQLGSGGDVGCDVLRADPRSDCVLEIVLEGGLFLQ